MRFLNWFFPHHAPFTEDQIIFQLPNRNQPRCLNLLMGIHRSGLKEYLLSGKISHMGHRTVLLRYFNPVGTDVSEEIGELPRGVPNNLMPFITQTAAGIRPQLKIFGSDYSTSDGTEPVEVFNVGTGQEISILKVARAFEQVNGLRLNYTFTDRIPLDLEKIWNDSSEARSIFQW